MCILLIATYASSAEEIDYKHSLKSRFNLRLPVENIPVRGIDESVSKVNLKNFIQTYLGEVRKSGIKELEKHPDRGGQSPMDAL